MSRSRRSSAFRFVLTMGVVNLFADVTYEGGASVNGPFLAGLGASAAAIAIIAGAGEFLGYALRSLSGYVSDRTGKVWPITFVGYALNLLVVPALALAGSLPAAAALVLAERVGRALRKPTVETMLSYKTAELGKGWVYALNTALDETGAALGPLLVALVLALGGGYRTGYAILLVPALLTLGSLTVARIGFPLPSSLERGRTAPATGFTRAYWLYMVGAALFASGLMSFEFVSFHLSSTGTVTGAWVPVLLSLSTAGGIVASLVLGRLYDRSGVAAVVVGILLSSAFAPLAFLGGVGTAVAGMMLWGVGYATQDTLFKAVIASVLPEGRRNLAFGLFYAGYGVGWLVGSVATGLLYDVSRPAMIAVSVGAQLAAVPFFWIAARGSRRPARSPAGAAPA